MSLVPDAALECARKLIGEMFQGLRGDDHRKKQKWEGLNEYWRNDSEVALAALLSDGRLIYARDMPRYGPCEPIRLHDVPDSLRNSKEFLLKAIAKNWRLWYELPSQFENDMAFVYAIEKFDSDELIRKIVDRFPEARSDRTFWKNIIDSSQMPGHYYMYRIDHYIENYASASIRMDQALMCKACRINKKCFHLLHHSLFEQRDFMECIVRSGGMQFPLEHIPHNAQVRYPDLVIESFGKINRFSSDSCIRSFRSVAPLLWADGNTVKYGWFQAGCPFIERYFPVEWQDDRGIFFLIADHCEEPLDSFEAMSTNLCASKDFILQLVALNPRALMGASDSLKRDFDVLTTAIANRDRYKPIDGSYADLERSLVVDMGDDCDLVEAFFEQLRSKIHGKLEAHSVLAKLILPAIKFGGGASSSLSLLNQGAETSKAYMTCIANYVGVPLGKQLWLLRQASRNILTSERIYAIYDEYEGDF